MRFVKILFVSVCALLGAGLPALADCTPSNPSTGDSVTCAPPGTAGLAAGAGVDNLTVTVQPNATVLDNGTAAIIVNNGNTIINNGTLTAGDVAGGILATDNNPTIINNGTITAGDGGGGILANDNNLNIVNNGTISVGDNGRGIFVNNGNAVTNNGSISVGNNSKAIDAGNSVTVNNSGSLIGLDGSTGIFVNNNSNGVTNSGSITMGDDGIGIQARDNNNPIINSGSIVVGNGNFAAGIVLLNSNTVINRGTITGGDGATGIALGNNNVITNTGTIQVGAFGTSFLPSTTFANSNQIFNSGTVDGRILIFSDGGSTSSNLFVNSGLITITNAGTPYTFHSIDGSFQQTARGTLALRFSPDNFAGYDTFSVQANNAGDQTILAGTLRAIIKAGVYQQTQTYLDVVTFCSCFGGTIQGTFDSVTSTSPFITATPTYNSNSVDITLTRVAFNAVPGLTPNQQAVGNALENGYSTGLTGNAATFYGNVLAATSVNVLNQLSGEGTTAAQGASFSAGTNFNMAMMQQGAFWQNGLTGDGNSVTFGGPTAYAEPDKKPGTDAFASVRPAGFDNRWRVWGLGFGATRSIGADATTGASSQTQRTFGGSFGVDHQIAGDLLIGAAVGASQSTFAVPNLSTNGTIYGGHIGLYGVKTWGADYMSAALSYAHFDNSTTRTITGAGPTEVATGNFGSDQINARLEAGRKYAFTGYTLTPFVATEPGVLFQRAYSETSTAGGGPGILGLNYMAHTTPSLPTFLGVQADTHLTMTNGYAFDPYARVSWVHEFMPKRQIEASFITVPGPSFTVDGARAYTDAARINTGVKVGLARDTVAFLNLEGEFASNSQSYSATAGMQTVW